jgi:RimJ/RimL family protein N-acetyltransferase
MAGVDTARPVELTRGAIRLRPFRPDELEAVLAARGAREQPALRERLERRFARSGRFDDGRLDLAVEADGELVGEIDVRHPPDAMPDGVYEFGIELFAAARRGRGHGTTAVELLAGYLFAHVGAERVQASTALGNAPMRRVLEKTGFAYEGTMRAFMPTAGGRDDYALYALTRADWEARPATPQRAAAATPGGAPA